MISRFSTQLWTMEWYSMGELPMDDNGYHGLLHNGKYLIYWKNRDLWLYDESEASWTEFEKKLNSSSCSGTPSCGQFPAVMIPGDFF